MRNLRNDVGPKCRKDDRRCAARNDAGRQVTSKRQAECRHQNDCAAPVAQQSDEFRLFRHVP